MTLPVKEQNVTNSTTNCFENLHIIHYAVYTVHFLYPLDCN